MILQSESAPAPRVYGSVDYLLWWVRRGPVPAALVTTAPETSNLSGVLGFQSVPSLSE